MLSSTLLLLCSALLTVATPLSRQDDGPNCEAFGANGFASSGSFKLAAVNTTLPNANTTGAPLTIATDGAVVGESFYALATVFSYPLDNDVTFSLQNGAMLPPFEFASDEDVEAGDIVAWLTTGANRPAPALIYCGVNNADDTGLPLLAVHGDTEGWALCLAGDWANPQNRLVYRPIDEPFSYLFDTCYPVRVHIVYTE